MSVFKKILTIFHAIRAIQPKEVFYLLCYDQHKCPIFKNSSMYILKI